MDGSPFSMVDKPLKMKGDENHVFRRPPADEARDGFVSNLATEGRVGRLQQEPHRDAVGLVLPIIYYNKTHQQAPCL